MPVRYHTTNATPATVQRLATTTTSGTAAVTINVATVTGTGTSFTTEYRVGDDIIINSERKTVIAVASNTSLTVSSVFAATVSGQAIVRFPLEAKGQNKVFTLIAHSTNTADITIGESTAPALDGSDITATSKSFPLSPFQPIGPIVTADLYSWFCLSTVASQKYSIIFNQ